MRRDPFEGLNESLKFSEVDIYLDGALVNQSETDGLADFSITIRDKTENGESDISFSSDIEFRGAAFLVIKERIIENAAPHLVEIPLKIISRCCKDGTARRVLFDGKITGDSVSWCEVSSESVCRASMQAVDASKKSKHLACLKNTIIWAKKERAAGGGFSLGEDEFRTAPRVVYAVSPTPRIWAKALVLFAESALRFFDVIMGFVSKVADRINKLISELNSLIPGTDNDIPLIDFDNNDITTNAQTVAQKRVELMKLILGLGQKHKAPFIHSYLENLCVVCGLTLSSDAFGPGAPFHNLMRLDCQNSEGDDEEPKIEKAWLSNRPNLNGIQFLDGLRKDFNIDWRIEGDVLYVNFDNDPSGAWFDMESEADEVLELCYEITKEKPKAGGYYEFAIDGLDSQGDEARAWWSREMDFGNPPLSSQSGRIQKQLPYGAARFRKDRRALRDLPIDEADFIDKVPQANDLKNSLILEKGKAVYPKLLLWDGLSPLTDALVERRPIDDGWDYNISMWMRDKYDQDQTVPTGWSYFFKRDDPTFSGFKGRTFTLRVKMTCARLGLASVTRGVRVKRGKTYVNAPVNEVDLKFGAGEIIIKGDA